MARPDAAVAIFPDREKRAQASASRSALAALPEWLAGLADMTRTELYEEWRRQFRSNPPDRIRRDILELGIAWKLQEAALGGLRKTAVSELRALADALAATGDIGLTSRGRSVPTEEADNA